MDNDFDQAIKNTLKVGEFLRAFDPILGPLEKITKHGISLATGFFALAATLVSLFKAQNPRTENYISLLFCSWAFFLGAIGFGTLQLWRTTRFRKNLRVFAYTLLGDKPSDGIKQEIRERSKDSPDAMIVIEYIAFFIGVAMFVLWVAMVQKNP